MSLANRAPSGLSAKDFNLLQTESAIDACLRHFMMNRLQLLVAVTSGHRNFRNQFHKILQGFVINDEVIEGIWRACKHMIAGVDLPDEIVLPLAAKELDTYQPLERKPKAEEHLDPAAYPGLDLLKPLES